MAQHCQPDLLVRKAIECAEHVGQLLICGHHCFHWSTTRMTVLDLAHRNYWRLLTFFGISNQELVELCHSYGFYDVERVPQYYSGKKGN